MLKGFSSITKTFKYTTTHTTITMEQIKISDKAKKSLDRIKKRINCSNSTAILMLVEIARLRMR